MDVFNVVGGFFTEIEDNTPDSEIVNVNASSIGTLYSRGNIGFSTSSIGVAVSQITDVVPTGFPWDQQRNAIIATGDIYSIAAGGAIGNVSVSGSIGKIVADSGNSPPPGVFAGLVGPIVATGDIQNVNIGQGIPSSGSGDFAQAGLFAGGVSNNVDNTVPGSDIRGDVVAPGDNEIFTRHRHAQQRAGFAVQPSPILHQQHQSQQWLDHQCQDHGLAHRGRPGFYRFLQE